jgi:peptidoglycan/LPS O-acetylase OafA/YrhL
MSSSVSYRADIDGLRAVAVVSVILFHLGVSGVAGGYVGVDIFFVISGFLITSILVREIDTGTYSIAAFYERRVRRIFPALFVVMAATTIAALFWLLPSELKDYGESLASATFFVANVLFRGETDYFEGDAELRPLLHTWSLCVEEQFYLLFPPLLALLMRLKRVWVIAIAGSALVLSFAASVWAVRSDPTGAFYLAHLRAWELLVGSMLALGAVPALRAPWQRHALSVAGALAIAFAIFTFDKNTTFPGESALYPTLGAAAIMHAGSTGPSWVGRLLSLRLPVAIGLVSYSLYLWHWPLIVFARHRALEEPPVAVLVGVAVATVVLSVASYYFVEKPTRRAGGKEVRTRVLVLAGVAMALSGALAAAMVFSGGLPGRVPEQVLAIDSVPRAGHRWVVRTLCKGDDKATLAIGEAVCKIGKRGAGPSFLLWGDSHAAALGVPFAKIAEYHGREGYGLLRGGCPPLFEAGMVQCSDKAPSKLLKDPAVKRVILHSRWAWAMRKIGTRTGESHGKAFRRLLFDTVKKLQAHGKEVVLFASVPEVGVDVPSTLAKLLWWGRERDIRPTLVGFKARQKQTFALFRELKAKLGVKVLYPHRDLCDDKYCDVMRDGQVLYRDDDHLARPGVAIVKGLLKKALLAPIAQAPGTPDSD